MKINHGLLFTLLLATTSCTDAQERGRPYPGADPVPLGAPTGEAPAPSETKVRRHAVPIAGLPSSGPADALVTIVEVTDYECPFCKRAEDTLSTLREKHPGEIRVSVIEGPLPMHPRAEALALAALAVAARDPNAFPAMHARLFDAKGARTDAELSGLAGELGISKSVFESALGGNGPREALGRAQLLAKDLHVRGTPAFFVNGRAVYGAQPLATFEALVNEELAHGRALMAAGVKKSAIYDAVLAEARANPAPFENADDDAPTMVPEARGVGGSPYLGSPDAKVTITLFTDLECPYCARLDARLRDLVAKRPDVRVVLRHSPLPMHEGAPLAAKGALAAEAQGKLGAFTALVFANAHGIERASLVEHARAAGLDVPRFVRDLDADWTTDRLATDQALAKKLGVRGTPTTFVEEERIVGAQPLASFERAIDDAKKR